MEGRDFIAAIYLESEKRRKLAYVYDLRLSLDSKCLCGT